MHSLPHYQHTPQSSTFVAIDESTLTHHNHSVYIRVHSQGCTFCGFGQMSCMSIIMVPYRVLSLSWKSSVLCLFIPSHVHRLATTDHFTVSIILPFPECPTVVIVQCVAFSNHLLSLGNIHLRFRHVLFIVWQLISFESWIILHWLENLSIFPIYSTNYFFSCSRIRIIFLVSCPITVCPTPGHKGFLRMLSSKTFIVCVLYSGLWSLLS